jgi:hypothetical protein
MQVTSIKLRYNLWSDKILTIKVEWQLYVPPVLPVSNCAVCIYGSCLVLGVNNDHYLKPVDLCNGEVWYSLWGTDCILKYYLDELSFRGGYLCLKSRVRKDSIRVEEKRKHLGESVSALYLRGKKSILLEGTQAMPARPSDKGRMRMKTLWWWVVKAWDRDGRILFHD